MIEIKIKDLLELQKQVNNKIAEKAPEKPIAEQYILAFNVEFFEYINAIGLWKWWKHSHKIDRERILDELADCFAFYLSLMQLEEEVKGIEIIDTFEIEMNDFLNTLRKWREESGMEDNKSAIIEMITFVASSNELGQDIVTIQRFTIAVFLAELLFEGITWDEMVEAFRKKSMVNIQRQENNY